MGHCKCIKSIELLKNHLYHDKLSFNSKLSFRGNAYRLTYSLKSNTLNVNFPPVAGNGFNLTSVKVFSVFSARRYCNDGI